ncbi:MAG: NADP-dependent oxidoreductase [Burkholderiales bacterium]
MRAAFIRHYGGNDAIEISDRPVPNAGPRDVLIRVRAAGVNPVDYKIRDGQLKSILPLKFPLILGNECAGVVEKCGTEVRAFKPGDAVYARLEKDRFGAYAEFAAANENSVALKPANLDFNQAAAIPLAGLTAWQALIEIGKLQAGQKVLIHAGSGGVGTFAIQLAKHLGAFVATTCSARNAALVKSLGADVVIDYTTQKFDALLDGYDLVFDTLGGDTQHRSFSVLRRGGALVTVAGIPTAKFGRAWGVNPIVRMVMGFKNRASTKLAQERGVTFKYLFMHPSGEQLREITRLIEAGKIKPVIDKTFDLDHLRDALSYSENGRTVGKVVITI